MPIIFLCYFVTMHFKICIELAIFFDITGYLLYTFFMREIIVDKKYNEKKLNTFLLDAFPGLSLNLLYKTLRKKDIRVNDVKVSENIVVHTNDHVKVYISDEQLLLSENKKIPIIYEDENIVVVNKPAGIEVVDSTFCLTQLLIAQKSSENFNTASNELIWLAPCHRLDRNTSGLVLFAKNEPALNILLEKFKNREIEKIYKAKVYGIPKVKEQLLSAYLFKDKKKSLVYISDFYKKGYVKIQTYYKVVSVNAKENTSVLEVNLLTGKTHQIRAHLAHIGYPIIGDGKYGNNAVNKKFHQSVQNLCSYSLTFQFTSDAGQLNYLNNKTITIKD